MKERLKRLQDTVSFLGHQLGETIIEVSGKKTFDLEEKLRRLSKSARRGRLDSIKKMEQIIRAQDSAILFDLTLAFNMFFELTNLAEENHRIAILQKRQSEFLEGRKVQKESIAAALRDLKKKKVSSQKIKSLFEQLRIELVFTAHPTESKRKTVLSKIAEISDLLSKDFDQLPSQTTSKKRLKQLLSSLWLTSRSRKTKPTVLDEVRRGLWFVDKSLYQAVCSLQQNLKAGLSEFFPKVSAPEAGWFRFASWVGGDRDGHPFVTPETTRETLQIQKELALKKMESLFAAAARELSVSAEHLRGIAGELEKADSEEPVRDYLNELKSRASHLNIQEIQARVQKLIDLLINTPAKNCMKSLIDLKTTLDVFGDHLLPLDLRQDSALHEQLMGQIFKDKKYPSLSEQERIDLLESVLMEQDFSSWRCKLKVVEGELKEQIIRPLEIFRDQDRLGLSRALGNYVISMTEGASDVLEVLFFQRLVGTSIPIVPLFETKNDLEKAPQILTEIYRSSAYQQFLLAQKNFQMVMLGYSDSNKDCGYATACWVLYQAQDEIIKVSDDFRISIEFFHGRGGTIARGGGRAADAILAQPVGLKSSRIRITEQGEVLSTRYQDPEIAKRVLEQVAYGVIKGAMLSKEKIKHSTKQLEEMQLISSKAHQVYQEFFHHRPAIIEFWKEMTPIDQIARLNIGSRPSFRKKLESLRDVRAIPWVFSWSQSRFCLPGWFGLGSGLNAGKQTYGLLSLQKNYKRWPFFKTLIDNAQLTLSKTDLAIAKRYLCLAKNRSQANQIFLEIENEYKLTKRLVLQITGQKALLDNEPTLKQSIQLRNPYIDPMNYIQVEALKRLRANSIKQKESLEKVVELSISGISGGLRNTG